MLEVSQVQVRPCRIMLDLMILHLMVLLPIDPVVTGEVSHHYIGCEGSGRIERSSSPVHTEQFCNKQGQANADRSNERRFCFLASSVLVRQIQSAIVPQLQA